MANSSIPTAPNSPLDSVAVPARTPGSLGLNDHGDPNITTQFGDTPGSLGVGDHADPNLPAASPTAGAAKLPDGTAIAPGLDGKAAKLTCPAPLASRSDDGAIDIDWALISAREGGSRLDGYVPDASGSKSGVTVATGFDIGAQSEAGIDQLDITDDLKKKLKPYCGKHGKDAQDYLKKNKLSITADEAASLDKVVKKVQTDSLVANYNAAVDGANAKDGCARVHFEKLPQSAQTAVASVSFQYDIVNATPTFWAQVTEQRWQDALDNLNNFGDSYKSRHKLEAGLVDDAMKTAPAPPPTTN
jgi:Bacterial toxin homologue of phage lysozyme, C-term